MRVFDWIKSWLDYRQKYQNMLLERDEALKNAIIVNGQYEYICSNLPESHSMSTRRYWEDHANTRLRKENEFLQGSLEHISEKFIDLSEMWQKNCLHHGFYMYKEWQPMDIAPKDGTAILCFEDGAIGIVRYKNGHFRNYHNPGKIRNPTYWMALPKEPKMTKALERL